MLSRWTPSGSAVRFAHCAVAAAGASSTWRSRRGARKQRSPALSKGAIHNLWLEQSRPSPRPWARPWTLRLQWHGEALDRLLDARHAAAVDRTVRRLLKWGWDVRTEVTFGIYGERGSVDILARHRATGVLLVVEVKSVVPDLQSMLASHDRKIRLAPAIAREQGWPPGPAVRLLVLVSGRTVRRRMAEHRATIATAYPRSSTAMRAWLRSSTKRQLAASSSCQISARRMPAAKSPHRRPGRPT